MWPWAAAALVLAVALSAWVRPEQPDLHYLRAEKLVSEYELGKAPEHLNYGDPVYLEALDELRRVKRDSMSAPAARHFSDELGRAVAAFREKRQAGRSRLEAARAAERERDRVLRTAQFFTSGVDRTAVLTHECEEDGDQPHDH